MRAKVSARRADKWDEDMPGMGTPASDTEVQMAGIASISSTGAGATASQLAIAYQAAALRKEVEVARDVGTAALSLIQSLVANSDVAQHLNVAA